MKSVMLVALGGAVGAVARHLASQGANQLVGRGFPAGTLAVNVVGSLILGALVAWVARVDAAPELKLLVGTGFCGALTTFSTFSVETLDLLQSGQRGAAFANLGLNLILGLSAAFLGMRLVGGPG